MPEDLTPDERQIVSGFETVCDEGDWSACRARLACDGEPTKAQRKIIRDLVSRNILRLERGGQDEDGQLIGGTFYGLTSAGRASLAKAAS